MGAKRRHVRGHNDRDGCADAKLEPDRIGHAERAENFVEDRNDKGPAAYTEKSGENSRHHAAGKDQSHEQHDFAKRHGEYHTRLRPHWTARAPPRWRSQAQARRAMFRSPPSA